MLDNPSIFQGLSNHWPISTAIPGGIFKALRRRPQVLVKIAGAIQKVGKETHSHVLGPVHEKPKVFRIQSGEEKNPFFDRIYAQKRVKSHDKMNMLGI